MTATPAPMLPPMTWTLAPDLAVLALRTPTLPPATATNTVFVGARPFIVDPATPHAAERDTLKAVIAAYRAAGRDPQGIVLTHHHPDHVGAATWLAAEEGLEIWAHERTAELLAGKVAVDRALAAGDSLDGWHVHHTPGHASGHVVLHDPARGFLVVGDMVATVGTIVVDPPDGHMASYLASLRALRALRANVVVPAHGAPIDGAEAVARHFDHYLRHREAREELVLSALGLGPTPLHEITRRAYPELAAPLLPLATRSALAHLEKLAEEGRAEAVDGGWQRRAI